MGNYENVKTDLYLMKTELFAISLHSLELRPCMLLRIFTTTTKAAELMQERLCRWNQG